jgi:uncharacterized membrane protein
MLDVLIDKSEEKNPPKGVIKMSDRADKPVKSLIKSITWRIVGTLDTMIISYILTGKLTIAISIGSVEVITKTILYYFHERIWAHIHRLRVIKFYKEEKRRNGIARVKQTA